jgi:ribonuclease Z
MELRILGSGSCSPSKVRNCSGYLLKLKGKSLLIDAGPGTYESLCRLGIDFQSIDEIFISHIHVDHVNDLPAILFTRKHCAGPENETLPVIHGPEGFEADFFNIMGAYGTQIISGEQKYTVIEHTPDSEPYQTGLVYVTAMAMDHSIPTVGYRFEHLLNSVEDDSTTVQGEAEEFIPVDLSEQPAKDMEEDEVKPAEPVKAFAYSGDTSPCENLVELARDADCFLMEISSDDSNPMEGHSTIKQAAEAAEEAGAKITIFTHISPGNDMADVERLASAVYGGMAIKAKDGMRLII